MTPLVEQTYPQPAPLSRGEMASLDSELACTVDDTSVDDSDSPSEAGGGGSMHAAIMLTSAINANFEILISVIFGGQARPCKTGH